MNKKIFSYDEALQASLGYFNGDELAAKVFVDKYALRDNENNLLEKTPEDMHKRIAREFARIEKNKFKNPLSEEEIFGYLDRFKQIILAGSPMSSIGNDYQMQSLGNCYVISSPFDSYGGITYSDQQLVQLMKRRGGVGIDISTIRPKGMSTKNAAKTTDGIAVFMERFSNSCKEVAQNGRRGAELLALSVHHPEIETFINIKKDLKKVTAANISVKITDEFMNAVKHNKDYELRWPVNSDKPVVSQKISAKKIWDQIIDGAWGFAEPGVLFFDTAKKYGLSDMYKVKNITFEDVASNPCGEIIMGVDSCRLGSINLLFFVKDKFTNKASFDYENFDKLVQIAQRLLDDMIELEIEAIDKILKKIDNDPEPDFIKQIEKDTWLKFKENCILGRRTGLGITALGDTLAALNIKYGSEESVKITEKIYKHLALASMKSSCLLAKELGAFPLYDKKIEKNHPFLERIFKASDEVRELHEKYGRRNISLTTTAPTGSVSILTQTTSGIEPVFSLSYKRKRRLHSSDEKNVKNTVTDEFGEKWEENIVYHHHLKTWMDISGEKEISKSPYHKATSKDIDWMTSVDLQAAAQKWVSHSISKTCNLPNNVTRELVSDIYLRAWESGCKGFTVYREGSRSGILIDNNFENKNQNIKSITKTHAPKRPKSLPCDIHHIKITKRLDKVRTFEYVVLVGLLGGEPYEIFAFENGFIDKKYEKATITKEKRGHYCLIFEDGKKIENICKDITQEEDGITRLISTSLRHGADINFIVHQLEKVRDGEIGGFLRSLARSLKKHIKDGARVAGDDCPECVKKGISGTLLRMNGCIQCSQCGWSKCS